MIGRGGRLVDLTPALAQDPSSRTTFGNFAIRQKTQCVHHNDALKNFS